MDFTQQLTWFQTALMFGNYNVFFLVSIHFCKTLPQRKKNVHFIYFSAVTAPPTLVFSRRRDYFGTADDARTVFR